MNKIVLLSAAALSSLVACSDGAGNGFNASCNPMTDTRDGQSYCTVTIGNQVWMAENLNYEVANSYCFKNDPAFCTRYGRLYSWSVAMDSAGTWSTNGKGCGFGKTCNPTEPVRGICPTGWHLPSKDEFETLVDFAGGKSIAGRFLKSQSGWFSNGNGTDAYGFNGKPSGGVDPQGKYQIEDGYGADFWCSSEDDGYDACNMFLLYNADTAAVTFGEKYSAYSVRCVRDVAASVNMGQTNYPDEEWKSSSSWSSSGANNSVPGKTLEDSRDGKTYRTVKIGTQTWMAENLNFETENSFCYDDDVSNCTKYGRLYTWAAAMDSVGTWSTNGKGCGYYKTCSPTYPVRGVCPEGWHLPTRTEWYTLFEAVGGKSTAGKVLKSASGWEALSGITNEDAYAFSALPAGLRDYGGYFIYGGKFAGFWSSTEYGSNDAYGMHLGYYYGYVDDYLRSNSKYNGFSVRCLKD